MRNYIFIIISISLLSPAFCQEELNPDLHIDYEFPSNLVTITGIPFCHFGKETDTLFGSYRFAPQLDEVTVTWMYRPDTKYFFKTLIQKISVGHSRVCRGHWIPGTVPLSPSTAPQKGCLDPYQ